MDVLVALEHRFARTPDGAAWTGSAYARPFWDRYLEAFEGVRVAARARDVAEPPPGWKRVDGAAVRFEALPYYVGPWQYAARWAKLRAASAACTGRGGAALLRVPSPIAAALLPSLRRRRQPYAVEVVGDPRDMLAPGVVRHPLRPLLRIWLARALRAHARRACGAAFVTERYLQRRYPCPAHEATYSSIELDDAAVARAPRPVQAGDRREPRLATVALLDQPYKGVDTFIRAVATLPVRAVIVGDGALRGSLEALARGLGAGDRVEFAGQLPAGAAVREHLDAADLFVLASRAEGLPRALIEAMARGLPCIATAVGGVPELLPAEDLVPPGDAGALARAIAAALADPARRGAMSARNLEAARRYRESAVRARRTEFYRHLRRCTEAWAARDRA